MGNLGEHWEILVGLLTVSLTLTGILFKLWMKNIQQSVDALHGDITESFLRLDQKIVGIRNIVVNLAQRVAHIEGRMGIDVQIQPRGDVEEDFPNHTKR